MISFEFHLEKWHEKTQKPLWFRGFSNRYLFRFAMLVAEEGCGCPVDTSVPSAEARTEAAAETLNQRSCIFSAEKILRSARWLWQSTGLSFTTTSPFELFALRAHNPWHRLFKLFSITRKNSAHRMVFWVFLVAEEGLEPTTFGLWARRATNCSTPRYLFLFARLLYTILPINATPFLIFFKKYFAIFDTRLDFSRFRV